jgi:hypothetical protein
VTPIPGPGPGNVVRSAHGEALPEGPPPPQPAVFAQTDKEDHTATRPGPQTKGRGQTHSRSANTRTIETVTILPAPTCAHGDAEFSDVAPVRLAYVARGAFLVETNGYRRAANIKRLLEQICARIAKKHRQVCLSDPDYANLRKR